MALEQIRAAGSGRVDRGKLAATTEADIRRHVVEAGEDPEAPLPSYQAMPDVQAIRERLRSRRTRLPARSACLLRRCGTGNSAVPAYRLPHARCSEFWNASPTRRCGR